MVVELEIQQLVPNLTLLSNPQMIPLAYWSSRNTKSRCLGLSLGSFIAQQLTITYPEKVNRLVLVAASCD
jgi:hypothetical protein